MQTIVDPLITPSCAGEDAVMLIVKDRTVLLPQVPLAFTVMFPPAVPEVAVMLLVVEVPVQPLGKVQV